MSETERRDFRTDLSLECRALAAERGLPFEAVWWALMQWLNTPRGAAHLGDAERRALGLD